MSNNYLRIKALKLTDDDWYGNDRLADCNKVWDAAKKKFGKDLLVETGKLVEVSLLSLSIPGGGKMSDTSTRVCIWGNDDCGMEKDFDNRGDATTMFLLVLAQKVVNKEWLKTNGFLRA